MRCSTDDQGVGGPIRNWLRRIGGTARTRFHGPHSPYQDRKAHRVLLRAIRQAILVAALILTGLLLFAAPSAFALQVTQHNFTSTFSGKGSGGGSVLGVAVNDSTGNVYTLGMGAEYSTPGEISQFDASGTPVPFPSVSNSVTLPGRINSESSIAVDNSTTTTQGRIYVADAAESTIYAYEPDGSEITTGNFPLRTSACGIGVDPRTGDFWVGQGFGPVTQFTSAGERTGISIPESQLPRYTCKMSVDSNGNLYVNGYQGTDDKFSPTGTFEYTLDSNLDDGVAVDPSTNEVYLAQYAEGFKIADYSASGSELTTFGNPPGFSEAHDIAVDSSSHDVYLSAGSEVIYIFEPGATVTLPGVTTGPASSFQATSVKLNGSLSPEGAATEECYFEWGETKAYGTSTPCAEGNVFSGSGEDTVSADVSGLVQGKSYQYRLVASNANGTIAGINKSFVPSAAPSIIERVTNVHSDSALLGASINPGGAETDLPF